jgi:DNA-binding LacI/PurR family transcriptional regulator
MRSLAKIAGVCPMTVSLSLRNHPSIPESTRERIRAVAEKNGYTPDPMVGRLMRHLRAGAAKRAGALICSLGLRFSHKKHGYAEDILEGAKERAEKLGFFLDRLWLDETGFEPARLKRLLRSRGVEAVLLLPMAEPLDLTDMLDWTGISAVATSATITAPHVHSVLPDQFGNMLLLCSELKREGARRIGLATVRAQDVRVRHRVAAASLWHNLEEGCQDVTPLVFEDWAVERDAFRKWHAEHKPDAIIGDAQAYLDEMRELLPARAREKTRFVCTSLPPGEHARYAGIEEDARGIGVAAVEQLDWLYQHGERGIPERPRVTLVTGHYRPAPGAKVLVRG